MIDIIRKYKKDIVCLLFLIISILIVITILTVGKYYGDSNDWINQHIMFPDYFRKLFYQTWDLFPQFASSIGGGQNIYNFSYYGFLSPVILPSYFLPWVNMIDYIIVSNIILLIISGILMYYFLNTNFNNRSIALTGAFMFSFSGPMLLHFHRHLMFVSYMPFLVLGLIGIDKYFNKKRTTLFLISVFLMIMTSYYYSVGGLIVLAFYGIYKIYQLETVNLKIFFYHAGRLLIAVIIAIMLASILLFPTLASILTSRGADIVNKVDILSLFKPNLSFDALLYGTYNVGALGLVILALVSSFFVKDRSTKILNFLLLLVVLFPIFQYILNGFLYVRAKVLIPFLPLFIFSSCLFLKDIIERKIDLKKFTLALVMVVFVLYFREVNKYFYVEVLVLLLLIYAYYRDKTKKTLFVFIMLVATFVGVTDNIATDYVTPEKRDEVINTKLTTDIRKVLDNDDTYYRFGNYLNATLNFNHIYNANYRTTSVYSSTYNDYYKHFNDIIMNNSRPSRNSLNLATVPNIFMSIFMNHKYIISKQSMLGYKKLDDYENIYVNENVLPFMYVSDNLITKEQFNEINYPYNMEVLLNNTVVDKKSTDANNLNDSNIKEVDINDYFNLKQLNAVKQDDKYILEFDKNKKITLKSKKKIKDKVVIITFDLTNKQKCSIGDQSIIINGTGNKKTCKSWMYYNNNENFSYVFSKSSISKLDIIFSKGKYEITNVHMYMMDYSNIENVSKKVTEVNIDNKKSKGDYFEGTVDVKKDNSYFVSSIPYDENFYVTVDNKKVDIEIVNTSFLGFPINKGKHTIKIRYKAPFRTEGIYISIFGIVMFLILYILEKENCYKKKSL